MEDDYEIYKEMLEKHRLIKNQNVHEKKPKNPFLKMMILQRARLALRQPRTLR